MDRFSLSSVLHSNIWANKVWAACAPECQESVICTKIPTERTVLPKGALRGTLQHFVKNSCHSQSWMRRLISLQHVFLQLQSCLKEQFVDTLELILTNSNNWEKGVHIAIILQIKFLAISYLTMDKFLEYINYFKIFVKHIYNCMTSML